MIENCHLVTGEALETLKKMPDECIQCCITSPPYYGLRDYGVEKQIGLEETIENWVQVIVDVFREVRRVLKKSGTLWVNLGDSYNGSAKGKFKGYKRKDLLGMPWLIAFALQRDGWYLRNDIIWSKTNPMPESVKDRFTKSHEYIFLFAKSEKYFFDKEAVRVPATGCTRRKAFRGTGQYTNHAILFSNTILKEQARKNRLENEKKGHNPQKEMTFTTRARWDVWTVTQVNYTWQKTIHCATYPEKLIEPCVLAGSQKGDYILDPFSGTATTGLSALRHGRKYVGIELNPEYNDMALERLEHDLAIPLDKPGKKKRAKKDPKQGCLFREET